MRSFVLPHQFVKSKAFKLNKSFSHKSHNYCSTVLKMVAGCYTFPYLCYNSKRYKVHMLFSNKTPDAGHTKRLRNKVWLGPCLEIAPLYINQRNMQA